jgi:hypothetical protein
MSEKICSKCRLVKPIEQFNFRYKARGIRHGYCKDCGKDLTRSHYKRTKAQYLKRNIASFARRRQIVIEAKQKPCADCGIQYPYYVMDFDHREGETKKFSLYKIHGATTKHILEEIAKCDVVCANCHRQRTHQRRLKRLNENE